MKRASPCSLALSLCALGIKHHHSDFHQIFCPRNREFPWETTDSFTVIPLCEGSTFSGQCTTLVSVPYERGGDGNGISSLVAFAVASVPSWQEEAGADLGGCGPRCAEQLPLRALIRKQSQGSDPQRRLGTYQLFNYRPTLILNRSWEHIFFGKFSVRERAGRLRQCEV